MLFALLLLAEADPISGGAGWAGAGLLGAVLAWLLFIHLPSKDKQIRELIVEHNGTVKVVAEEHSAAMREVTKTFKEETKAERVSCESHFSRLADAMGKASESNMAAMRALGDQLQNHAERNRQWIELLQKEIQARLAVTSVAQAALEKGKS